MPRGVGDPAEIVWGDAISQIAKEEGLCCLRVANYESYTDVFMPVCDMQTASWWAIWSWRAMKQHCCPAHGLNARWYRRS